MEVEERFGLKRKHTYDEIVAWLNSDPKGVPYPNRVAFQTYNSHVYGQLKDSLRSFTVGQDAYNAYLHGDEHAPFAPPRPQFRQPPEDTSMGGGGPPDDDDDLMGPPGPGPNTYPDLLQPDARSSDQVLLNEGINPPNPPPPPPPPSFFQQAQGAFANAAGNAAGQTMGQAAGQAAVAGIGQMLARAAAAAGAGGALGAEGGPPGMLAGAAIGAVGSFIGNAMGNAADAWVRRGFTPGGGSSNPAPQPVPIAAQALRGMAPADDSMRARHHQFLNRQELINRQQHAHNQGGGAPAAQIDFRSLNGQNESMRPRDRKPKGIIKGVAKQPREINVGLLGGRASGSGDPLTPARAPAAPAPVQAAGTAIPRDADPAPPAAHSYNDLVGKIKKAEPVGPSRPRERSPRRGDRRPIEVQRREEAKNRRGGGVLFPGGDGREEAIAMRSKTIPKEEPKKGKTPEYYIGDQGVKRKSVPSKLDMEESGRRGMPNPAPGNSTKRTGQKRIARGPPDPENLQPRRKPPPKPEGRLNKPKRKR